MLISNLAWTSTRLLLVTKPTEQCDQGHTLRRAGARDYKVSTVVLGMKLAAMAQW